MKSLLFNTVSRGLVVAIAFSISAAGPGFAMDDTKEQTSCSELHNFIQKSFAYPASEARNKGENQRAIELYKRAIDEWKEQHYRDQWSIDNQRCQMCSLMRSEADVYRGLGNYEEAALLYLQSDKEWRKRGGNMGFNTELEAGRIYAQGKMFDKATQIFDEVAQSGQPNEQMQAHIALSQCYETQDKAKPAESELTDMLANKVFSSNPSMVRIIRTQLKELYVHQHRPDDVANIEKALDAKVCPVCKSSQDVIPIGYGYPGPQMYQASAKKEMHLGGCMVGLDRWWCEKDHIGF